MQHCKLDEILQYILLINTLNKTNFYYSIYNLAKIILYYMLV